MALREGENRIGTVSSVDAATGMVSVVYEDRDGEVTELLPYATFNDEYKLPQIGAKVVVLHLSNGGEMVVFRLLRENCNLQLCLVKDLMLH